MYLRVNILFAFAVLIGTTSLAKPQRTNIVGDPSVNMLSPAKSMSRIRLAPGYLIELIAHAPMVVDPVAMAWDADGALYVVELRSYMLDADATGEHDPTSQVVKLVDTKIPQGRSRPKAALDFQ